MDGRWRPVPDCSRDGATLFLAFLTNPCRRSTSARNARRCPPATPCSLSARQWLINQVACGKQSCIRMAAGLAGLARYWSETLAACLGASAAPMPTPASRPAPPLPSNLQPQMPAASHAGHGGGAAGGGVFPGEQKPGTVCVVRNHKSVARLLPVSSSPPHASQRHCPCPAAGHGARQERG